MNSNTEHLTMSRVSCSYDFFIKCLISKKKKKEKKERKKRLFRLLDLHYVINHFIFFFMIHEATRYTRY